MSYKVCCTTLRKTDKGKCYIKVQLETDKNEIVWKDTGCVQTIEKGEY